MVVNNKTVFGLIGVGNIAQSQHLPNMARSGNIRLKTICDVNQILLNKIQEKYNIPEARSNYLDLLADPEIDAVLISTKAELHSVLAIKALEAGKHIYVEKPLANTVSECEKVKCAQKKSGCFAVIGFNRRYAPAYRKAKDIIRRHGGASNIYYRMSDELWKRWKNEKNSKGHIPGTSVIHEACHVFDILRWFTDSEVKSVYCVSSRPDDQIITLQFESGCVATVMASAYATLDMPKERVEIIVNGKGGVIVEEFVELRTYGLSDAEHVSFFHGHSHPERELLHKYLFNNMGAPALYSLRRMAWEMKEMIKGDEMGKKSDIDEIKNFIASAHHPDWNYMVDKGWFWALDHFAQAVKKRKQPDLATVNDGLKANIIGNAALQSLETSQVIDLRKTFVPLHA